MPITVRSLRRYPVKSMAGEDLDVVALDRRGLTGDRWYAVVDGEGHFASGKNTRRFRRRDAVFDYAATTTARGVVVTGPHGTWPVGDPDLDLHLSAAMGVAVGVLPEGPVPHQDMGSVSVISTATLRWCADRWGGEPDARRLRANVVVSAEEPFIEETWEGRQLRIGNARLGVLERVPRCRMIDIAQDGVDPAGRWLKALGEERDLCLAMYADVLTPGAIAVGDVVQID